MLRKMAIYVCLFLGLGLIFAGIFFYRPDSPNLISPLGKKRATKSLPLEKYYFENLRKREYPGDKIILEREIKRENTYASWLFSYKTEGKRVTGLANLPERQGRLPVIIMLRGYADDQIYFTGLGTRKAAGVFAENGYIVLAPDFLGFGDSDSASDDILEARFERPITVLDLLSSIKTLPQADPGKIFLWGHSNGGQIALSVLEITRRSIPTTLWAPVTRGFPDSVLAYMGELDDQGLKVKAAIEQFLADYDPKKVSVDNYWQDIESPIQVHQGLSDPLVFEDWSDRFVEQLESLGKDVLYFKYPKSDHNLKFDWDLVVERDLKFFKKYLAGV